MTETDAPRAALDGRHDFDFLHGHWHVANRKLSDPFDKASDWHEFPATVENRPILSGLGNIDLYAAPDFPERPQFEALAVRLFDTGHAVWRIWWASTVGGGQLDTPLVGRFQDAVGIFECDDILAGRELKIRFEWTDITADSARWQQSFSFDSGQTWQPNWVMDWKRRH